MKGGSVKTKERTERMLERSGRISPREVLGAYRETGLVPSRHVFVSDGEACAIGAVVAAGIGVVAAEDQGNLEDALFDRLGGASSDYRDGFVGGFDGEPFFAPDYPEELYGWMAEGLRRWHAAGWRDGRRVRRFVFASGSPGAGEERDG